LWSWSTPFALGLTRIETSRIAGNRSGAGHGAVGLFEFILPRLQVSPREDMERMRAEENAALNSYGWVDPARGIAHIPIDQAMDLMAMNALPERKPPPDGSRRDVDEN
jgi:hypothetical protein